MQMQRRGGYHLGKENVFVEKEQRFSSTENSTVPWKPISLEGDMDLNMSRSILKTRQKVAMHMLRRK